MNRLTNATAPAPIPNQPAGGSGALAYGYDWVGNRIHPPSGANPMVYNKADQLTSWPGVRQYTYYGDGSLQHVLNAGGTSTLSSYTYTPTGLLATANYGNSRTLTNAWDADSQRVGMSVEGHDYEFAYDTTAGIPAVIEEVNAGSTSTTTAYYFRDPGGSLISRVEGANTSYYHFDALGSTRLLTDVSENVTDKYAYDAYGSLISHDRLSGSVDQPYQFVGRFGYYTHWQEPEFGLMQLGVRFYDAEVGRFTQSDAIQRDDISAYAYVNDAPLVYIDSSGKFETPIGCINNAMKAADRIHNTDDKLAHCFFACRAARCFGILRFCPLFPITEDVIGRIIEKYWSNDDPEDANMQTVGIAASYTSKTCRQACTDVLRHLRDDGDGRYMPD